MDPGVPSMQLPDEPSDAADIPSTPVLRCSTHYRRPPDRYTS